jgi:uncharacterized protein (DUF58 family)
LVLLCTLLYGLFFVGLATLNGGVIALAIPLAIFLGATLLVAPREIKLTLVRTLSEERVYTGTPVVVHLAIANEGARLEEIRVEDLVPASLDVVDGDPRALVTLGAGETLKVRYTVKGERGQYDFSGVHVSAGDHLGLYRRQVALDAFAQLTVLPDVVKPKRVPIRPPRTRAYAGPIPARQGGSGVEFFGVREYQMGDPQRWINWRASARHPRSLFTNEFEQERVADVGLILDARQQTQVQSGDGRGTLHSLFEHSVRATASLADTFLGEGNHVGLLVYGLWLDWTAPGYGKVQRERILNALARAEIGESTVFDSLDYIPTRFFPSGSQLVLISPLCADDLRMLVRLRMRGYAVLVISPDPVAFEMQGALAQSAAALRTAREVALAAKIARVERGLLLRQIKQAGIRVVDWDVTSPIDQAIHSSLGRMPYWFRTVGWEE